MLTANVRINEPGVQSFMLPGQPVYEEIWKVSRNTGQIARELTAPVRTGRLRRSIQANRPNRTGPYTNTALVFAKIGYGLFVHEGTKSNGAGYITPATGKFLTIPRGHEQSTVSGGTLRKTWKAGGAPGQRGPKPFFTARRIRGQKANPFLEEALHIAMPR